MNNQERKKLHPGILGPDQICRFTAGLVLAMERGRAQRYDRSLRVCKLCANMGSHLVEDEYHVL